MRTEIIKVDPRYVLRAFPLAKFFVLCPVCSTETRLPANPRRITKEGDGVFTCFSCKQLFLYNPFVDRPSAEIQQEVIAKAQEIDWGELWARTCVGVDSEGLG